MKPLRLYFVLAVLLCGLRATAINHYVFQRQITVYSPLTDDTLLPPGNFASGDLWTFGLVGDTFIFFQKPYVLDNADRYIAFSGNGHLHIQDDTSLIIFDGLFYWLDSVDNTSAISYKVEGAGANKILKVQWKNLRVRSGPAGNYVNLQMWLYKATGAVEMRYGPSSANNISGYTNATGPSIGMFYSNATFANMHEKIWVNGLPATYTLDSARNLVFNGIHGIPPTGTIYRFIPRQYATGIGATAGSPPSLEVFPNPASSKLMIRGDAALLSKKAILRLIDLTGREVASTAAQNGMAEVGTMHLADGVYYLQLSTPGQVWNHPVVIKR